MSEIISGYRELSAEEVSLINEIKAKSEECGALIARLRYYQIKDNEGPSLILDQGWVSIGQTHLQEGFMALTRSVAQPTTF